MVHDQIHFLYRGFPRTSHPMAMLMGAVSSLSALYHDQIDINNPEHRQEAAIKLLAKIPTLAAMAYKYSVGQPFMYPKDDLDYSANFLYMMFALPNKSYTPKAIAAKVLDLLFILHADHEQNASTSTVRLVGSTNADPFAAVGAGIAALWGPAHGGANEDVIKMLQHIEKDGDIESYIDQVKNPKDKKLRLAGFGHRVYKNYDPRAKVIRKACQDLLGDKHSDPLLEIAQKLETLALNDDYFIQRQLYPNVDFYSGIIYRALGIPLNMFTVMFTIARTVGWMAQWQEMREDKDNRIGRPGQVYIGEDLRHL